MSHETMRGAAHMGDRALLVYRSELVEEAARHKSQVSRGRTALQRTKSQIEAVDIECRRRGLSIPHSDEGDQPHGRQV